MNRVDALTDARITLASLPLVAQGLAGKANVRVVIDRRAHTASTDGSVIRLPALPLPTNEHDLEPARDLATLAYGFIPHEVGHVRFTDFKVFTTFAKKGPVHKYLLNVLEDPRIEEAQIRDYPGNRHHLDRMIDLMIDKGAFPPITSQSTPDQALSCHCLYYLRAGVRGSKRFLDLYAASRPSVVELLGESFVTRLDVLLATQGRKLASTQQAADLATAILRALKEAAQEAPPPQNAAPEQESTTDASDDPSDGESPEGDKPDDSDSSGSNETEQDEEGEDGASAAGQDSGEDDGDDAGDQSSSTGSTDGQDQAQRDRLQEILDGQGGGAAMQDLGDMVAEAISEATNEFQDPSESVADSDDVVRQLREQSEGNLNCDGRFDTDAALSASAKLRSVLQTTIQAKTLQRTSEALRGHKLNQRRLYRTGSGDRRIFLHEEERKGLDTAIFLLCDISGSMSGNKIVVASQAAYATAHAMSQINGVTCAVGVFPCYAMVSQFGSSPRTAPERFALRPTGSTPLAEGILWASRKLAARREARKILLVATDGEPDSVLTARTQIEVLHRQGIEAMGLGIAVDSVCSLFRTHCVINTVEEMPQALFGMLHNTLHQQLLVA